MTCLARTVAFLTLLCSMRVGAQRANVLTPLAPIHITDFANAPLTRPRSLALDGDGGFYISDNVLAIVERFSAGGAPMRKYGARGDGPGEFRGPAHITVVNDTLLAIADVRRRDINLFNRVSGAFLSRIPVAGMPGSLHARGNVLWVGALDVATRLGVARISIPDGKTEASVTIPSAYAERSPVSFLHYEVHVVPDAAGTVVGFAASDVLLVMNPHRPTDTIPLPARLRRGVPPRLGERVAQMTNPQEFYELMSSMIALEPVAQGTLLVAHADITQRPGATFPPTPGQPDPFTHKLFVSLINLATHTACVDIAVPISGEQAPSVAMHGDTLFVLDQDTASDQPWIVRRFVIRESECAWQPARANERKLQLRH